MSTIILFNKHIGLFNQVRIFIPGAAGSSLPLPEFAGAVGQGEHQTAALNDIAAIGHPVRLTGPFDVDNALLGAPLPG